jgi:primosomal protein N' (replication factor Y) (superfamily II helicase)
VAPGIERLAEEIKELIPQAKIICLTQESFYKVKDAEEILKAIEEKEYDIIIGTQIIAKGHHFPALTLVGVIDADSSMAAGDLRAAEKTYQLLQQVSGRAGRELKNSNIYIQTYNPDHPLIQSLVNYERENFIKEELKARKAAFMPPISKLGAIIISSKQEQKLIEFAKYLLQVAPQTKEIEILGPAPAINYKVRDKYRYRFLIKCAKNINLQHFFNSWINCIKIPNHIHLKIDIDPYYFA